MSSSQQACDPLRNAMIDSTTTLFVVVFAFGLAGATVPPVVAGVSYVLAIVLGAVVRWGIAVHLFPPGSLIGEPDPHEPLLGTRHDEKTPFGP